MRRWSRLRLALVGLGLLIVLVSCAALAYAYLPPEISRERLPLSPTLLVPPAP